MKETRRPLIFDDFRQAYSTYVEDGRSLYQVGDSFVVASTAHQAKTAWVDRHGPEVVKLDRKAQQKLVAKALEESLNGTYSPSK